LVRRGGGGGGGGGDGLRALPRGGTGYARGERRAERP